MTIHLPQDVESSLQAAVHNGHFASLDEAMTEAARLLLRELKLGHPPPGPRREPARPAAGHLAGRPRGDRRDRGRGDAAARRGTLAGHPR